MRALVTGAAGFLGGVLVHRLTERGVAVRALFRGEAPSLPAGAEPCRADVTDQASLASAVEGCDLVFHLAGVRRAAVRDEFMAVNADATRSLLEACLARGAARTRFVLAGSLAAAGPSRTGRREEEPLEPAEWYGESKAEAERITLSYRDRLPVTVARPPRIVGPGDRENLLFFKLAARGLVLRLSGPERPISWIDVEDCARGFLLLAERPEAVGEPFFLASAERTSLAGLLASAARVLGVRTRDVPLPASLLSAAAALADLVTRATGRRLPLNRKLARQLLAPGWACDPGKARERLGFVAETPLSDSIERSARWYRAQGWL
ncbi:MAG: NAD-dependent epimerase/dehydratase family protein [Deltaproteobacteria bacterium]|nr:NAD-dependent epimerase/dehydratase family protein [Deltaproteobacteria bacterium]